MVDVSRSFIVKVYNQSMGGVDLLDMLVAFVCKTQRSKKWYLKLFFHLIGVVDVNRRLLYREDADTANITKKRQLTLLKFKAEIAWAL